MFSVQTCIRVFALIGFLPLAYQRRNFYIRLDTCDIHSTSSVCKVNCTITKTNRTNLLTTFIDITEDILKYGISFQIAVKPPQQDYINILEYSLENICPYLKKKNKGNLYYVIIDDLLQYAKFPLCPFSKDVFYLKNYYFSPDNLPPYVPEGQFRILGKYHGFQMNGSRFECVEFLINGAIRSTRNPFKGSNHKNYKWKFLE